MLTETQPSDPESAAKARSGNGPVVLHARVVTGTGGGPDKTILNSPRFLEPHGYQTHCAFMHPPGDPGIAHLERMAREARAQFISIPDRGPWDTRVVRHMAKLCRDLQVSIWHGHDYKSNLLGLVLRRWWPMRLATTVHGWVKFTARTPLYYWVDRQCLRRYDRVICVSPDLHQRCIEARVPAERCVLIENAIDVQQYSRSVSLAEAKRRLGVPPDQMLIGAVGRLSQEKGFALLIEAVANLVAAGHDVGLVIAGEGDDRDRLQRLIGCQPDASRYRLLGHCADPRDVYQALDIFVLSSLREGLPNVVLEAMAMEIPVVASRVAGVPRVIEDGCTGLLFDTGDSAGLTEHLRHLMANPSARLRLAAGGRLAVHGKFSFAKRMERVCGIYDELTGQTDPGVIMGDRANL